MTPANTSGSQNLGTLKVYFPFHILSYSALNFFRNFRNTSFENLQQYLFTILATDFGSKLKVC